MKITIEFSSTFFTLITVFMLGSPLFGALVLALAPIPDHKKRQIALIFSIFPLLITLFFLWFFCVYGAFAFVFQIDFLKVSWKTGFDISALLLLCLSAMLIFAVLVTHWSYKIKNLQQFLITFLGLEFFLLGLFCFIHPIMPHFYNPLLDKSGDADTLVHYLLTINWVVPFFFCLFVGLTPTDEDELLKLIALIFSVLSFFSCFIAFFLYAHLENKAFLLLYTITRFLIIPSIGTIGGFVTVSSIGLILTFFLTSFILFTLWSLNFYGLKNDNLKGLLTMLSILEFILVLYFYIF